MEEDKHGAPSSMYICQYEMWQPAIMNLEGDAWRSFRYRDSLSEISHDDFTASGHEATYHLQEDIKEKLKSVLCFTLFVLNRSCQL